MRLYYTLTTIDPVIVSQSNATTNNHECLDHIPGSAILGLFASKHYQSLSEEQSWKAFHSGACRFSPCYPLLNEQLCLPIPASWHYAKGDEVKLNNQLNLPALSNHATRSFTRDETKQYKQCRDGYLDSNANIPVIRQGLTTKTAIDRHTGKAKESHLFSYAYLEANQKFAGFIDCPDTELLEQLKESLNQVHRLGRSRNTEFGRVKLNIAEVKTTQTSTAAEQLVLWCISDCEILNQLGMPTLSPLGEDIHPTLKNITLNKGRSFIRTAKKNRFNQKRQGVDSEQLLIAKGSVLAFDLNAPMPADVIQDIENQGIGINKQQGLGWIQVNPAWSNYSDLTSSNVYSGINISATHSEVDDELLDLPDSPLLAWVKERVTENNNIQTRQNNVNTLLQSTYQYYRNARSYNNIINSNEAGPSSTQWRRIAEKTRNNETQWNQGVFNGPHAICNAKNDQFGWGIIWHDGKKLTDFSQEITELLSAQSVETMRLLLEQLCRFDLSTYQGLKDLERTYKFNISVVEKEVS
jgi:CRISPR-associated protein Csx10